MSHRVEEWMGKRVETLEDLLRPELRARLRRHQPIPTSVRAGHYQRVVDRVLAAAEFDEQVAMQIHPLVDRPRALRPLD